MNTQKSTSSVKGFFTSISSWIASKFKPSDPPRPQAKDFVREHLLSQKASLEGHKKRFDLAFELSAVTCSSIIGAVIGIPSLIITAVGSNQVEKRLDKVNQQLSSLPEKPLTRSKSMDSLDSVDTGFGDDSDLEEEEEEEKEQESHRSKPQEYVSNDRLFIEDRLAYLQEQRAKMQQERSDPKLSFLYNSSGDRSERYTDGYRLS